MAKAIIRKSSVSAETDTTTAVLDRPAPTPHDSKHDSNFDAKVTPSPAATGDNLNLAPARKRRLRPVAVPFARFSATQPEEEASNRQAELFYLQKQIQQQTQMVIILEDGERIQGIIEWYDRHSIKVRGKNRVLVYKAAIKYLYKAGEIGTAPER